MNVYAVVDNGYYPLRVDSLWAEQSDAEVWAEKKGGCWTVCMMAVHGKERRRSDGQVRGSHV